LAIDFASAPARAIDGEQAGDVCVLTIRLLPAELAARKENPGQ
jgi:hypothetical protein